MTKQDNMLVLENGTYLAYYEGTKKGVADVDNPRIYQVIRDDGVDYTTFTHEELTEEGICVLTDGNGVIVWKRETLVSYLQAVSISGREVGRRLDEAYLTKDKSKPELQAFIKMGLGEFYVAGQVCDITMTKIVVPRALRKGISKFKFVDDDGILRETDTSIYLQINPKNILPPVTLSVKNMSVYANGKGFTAECSNGDFVAAYVI